MWTKAINERSVESNNIHIETIKLLSLAHVTLVRLISNTVWFRNEITLK